MPVSTASLVQEITSSSRASKDKEDEWENIRARVKADEELTQKLKEEEMEKYSEVDQAKMLVDLINQRKRFFAQQRAEAKRNKLMTQAQQRTYMSNYIKNQEGGYSIKQLKSLSFEEVKEIFETNMRRVHSFVPMDSELELQRLRRAGSGEEQSAEKEKEVSEEELQKLLVIVPVEEVYIEALQIFEDMLKRFYRDDLEKLCDLVKKRFKSTEPTVDKEKFFKTLVDNVVTKHTIDPEMLKIDVEPITPKLLNKKTPHPAYIKHTQEEATVLKDLVEHVKSTYPLDHSLESACRYAKLIQELLTNISKTCPSINKTDGKLVAMTPKNKDKRVRFTEPVTSSGNTNTKTSSSSNLVSNKPMCSSTEVKPSTSASGSQPLGNTKKYKIQQTPSSTQKNKVEAHPRKVKSSLKNKECVVAPKGTAYVQHSKLNVNSEIKYVKCNGCMLSDNHDMCVLDFINNVNAHRPTGRTFTIVGNACSLTRITTTTEVPLRKPNALENEPPKPVVTLVYSRKPRKSKTNVPVSKSKVLKSISANKKEPQSILGIYSTVKFGNDHVAKILGYGDYQIGNVTISRVYYIEGLGHNLFSVGQFCDSNLEVAFRQHTCFIRNLEGFDLLTGSQGNNLNTLSLSDMMASSPICLFSKALKTKSWLWHRRLSHLIFGAINHLARHGLVRGLPKLNFEKDHLATHMRMSIRKKELLIVVDQGMTWKNQSYLTEYEDYNGGFISFRDGKGRISGKGKRDNIIAGQAEKKIEPEQESEVKSLDQLEAKEKEVEALELVTKSYEPKTPISTHIQDWCYIKLEDADGTSSLPNTKIFEQLALMGPKKTAWEQFSSNIATAIICLATNRTFNFSKMIFEGMVKNLDSRSKFLMYPRFIQILLNKHQRLLLPHKRTYVAPTLTQKLFSNMRRVSKGYTGVNIPLFSSMLVQGPIQQGEGSTVPVESHHTPITTPSTSQPPLSSPSRVPTPPHDSPLPGGHTPGSDEGSMTLNELTVLCTQLSTKVASLEQDLKQTKKVYSNAYTKLIMRVKKLEHQVKSRQPRRRARVVISDTEEDLEDPSK
ncbi:retrovirus-related pol polyprotein from transposon TNT 1-94 [Tanacetum coccineum]